MRQYVATYLTFAQNQDQHSSILYHYFTANDKKLPGSYGIFFFGEVHSTMPYFFQQESEMQG